MSAIQLYAMYECVHVRGNLCAGEPMCGGTYVWGTYVCSTPY